MVKRTVLTRARDLLVRFDGGVSVIPAATGAGPVNADGTQSECASPVLLIRNVTAGVWFAAGLPGSATTSRL